MYVLSNLGSTYNVDEILGIDCLKRTVTGSAIYLDVRKFYLGQSVQCPRGQM